MTSLPEPKDENTNLIGVTRIVLPYPADIFLVTHFSKRLKSANTESRMPALFAVRSQSCRTRLNDISKAKSSGTRWQSTIFAASWLSSNVLRRGYSHDQPT